MMSIKEIKNDKEEIRFFVSDFHSTLNLNLEELDQLNHMTQRLLKEKGLR